MLLNLSHSLRIMLLVKANSSLFSYFRFPCLGNKTLKLKQWAQALRKAECVQEIEQLKNWVRIKVCIWSAVIKKVDSFILHPQFSILHLKSPLDANFLLLESKEKKVNILDPSAQCVPYLSASLHTWHIQHNTCLIIVTVSPFTHQ